MRFLFVFFFASVLFGDLHDFQKGGISYEWEAKPDFYYCKKVFSDAFIKCYDPIPLDQLGFAGRAAMVQMISDAFDEMYLQYTAGEKPAWRWITAKEEGVPVGCLLIDLAKYPEEVYLAQMAVDPWQQRRGIASAMIRSLFEQLPETKRFVVITRRVNQEARALYRALGFADSDYMHEGYSSERYVGFEYVN